MGSAFLYASIFALLTESFNLYPSYQYFPKLFLIPKLSLISKVTLLPKSIVRELRVHIAVDWVLQGDQRFCRLHFINSL